MSLEGKSKCPVAKIRGIITPVIALVNKVRGSVDSGLRGSDSPYTFQFGKKYLGLKNVKSDVNKITSQFSVDELYDIVDTDGPTALYEYSDGNSELLKNWCESRLSIGITRKLIQEGKNMNIKLLEETKKNGIEDVLRYLHSEVESKFYDIAIEYIKSLREERQGGEIGEETKFLYLCMAFAELNGEEGLPKDTMEVIFQSGISNTVTAMAEAIHLKLVSGDGNFSDLEGLVEKNKVYWNDQGKTNTAVNYFSEGLGYRIVSGTIAAKEEGVDNEEVWHFEPNSIKIAYSFSEKEFVKFFKKFRKKFAKLGIGTTYVGCPLLYERDDENNSNLIIAYNEVILQLFLNGLNQYYLEESEN